MHDNKLVTASLEKITILDKLGERQQITPDPEASTITRILHVSPNYLYFVGGPDWILEAYDLSKDAMLWKMPLGRTVAKVFYDDKNDRVYLTKDDSVQAIENSTGKVLWQRGGIRGQGILYEDGILYIPSAGSTSDHFRLTALDVGSQETIWEREIRVPPEVGGGHQAVVNDLLLYSGGGMMAIDKSSGELLWTISNVGEEFYTLPVEVDGTIYVKGQDTGAVYAIDADNGMIMGHLRLEDLGWWSTARGGLHALKDGIIFNSTDELMIYEDR
jgi:outer membrane protein assembly factor BamB